MASRQVVDDIRMPQAFLDLIVVVQVPFLSEGTRHRCQPGCVRTIHIGAREEAAYHRNHLAEISHNLEMALLILVSVRDDDLSSLLCEPVDQVASEEASAAKHSRRVAGNGGSTIAREERGSVCHLLLIAVGGASALAAAGLTFLLRMDPT